MAIKGKKASGTAKKTAKKTAKTVAKKRAKRSAGKPAGKATVKAGPDKLYTGQVRELVDLMVANDLTSVEITNGELSVSLQRGGAVAAAVPVAAPAVAPALAPVAAGAPAAAIPEVEAVEDFPEVKSPIVGTFYSAPSPDVDPFVNRGDRVSPDTVVCIIEAMKVMNEIRAECSGVIEEIVVENGQPVEYGQPLFRVRP